MNFIPAISLLTLIAAIDVRKSEFILYTTYSLYLYKIINNINQFY